ncbi:rubrerythrin [Ruminococcus sp.]|uniref:rubrerythrin n=1 Tax=Ruminococcus sp. TaxID=41978 RepID=UPI0025E6876D|nr:rubrerythrin family protein [Ruminococcus sp.]
MANSKTKENLMRAFAGESQARNRYTFAQRKFASQDYAVSELFRFTAEQERAHAQVFYEYLKGFSGQQLQVCGDYPVDISDDLLTMLELSVKDERNESEVVYPEFARIAREEGFADIARSFENIAKIENAHAERFSAFADLLRRGQLYSSDEEEVWVCMNCGFILTSSRAPEQCPVCNVPQGYYIRLKMTEWGIDSNGF